MRTRVIISALLILTVAGISFAGNGNNGSTPIHAPGELLNGIAVGNLDSAEREGLLLMREEEKLARDVYTELAKEWDLRVFSNIARSEQTHMDSVAELLDRYDISDPIVANRTGAFNNSYLGDLYDGLTEKGEGSITEALKVGALIEELDIADLRKLISETDNEDITLVYENLLAGSENHLRAFLSQLGRYGEDYDPTYLNEKDIAEIVNNGTARGSRRNS